MQRCAHADWSRAKDAHQGYMICMRIREPLQQLIEPLQPVHLQQGSL